MWNIIITSDHAGVKDIIKLNIHRYIVNSKSTASVLESLFLLRKRLKANKLLNLMACILKIIL